MMVLPDVISVMTDSSGKSTSCRMTNSRNSRIPKSTGRGGRFLRGFFCFLNQAAHCVSRLGPPRQPVIDSLKFEGAVLTWLFRIIGSDQLKQLPIARTPALRHHHSVIRPLARAF